MPFSQLFDLNPNKAHKVIVGTVKDGIKYILTALSLKILTERLLYWDDTVIPIDKKRCCQHLQRDIQRSADGTCHQESSGLHLSLKLLYSFP